MHIAKQRHFSQPANKRDNRSTRKYYHNTLTYCDGQRRNESVPVQSRGTSVSLQIKERKDVAQGNIIIIHLHPMMDKGETSVCTGSKQTELMVRLISFQ